MTIAMFDYKARADELASAYWQERWKPGGTRESINYEFTVDPYGTCVARKVGSEVIGSRRSKEIWDAMGALTDEAVERSRARLIELGVPAEVARWAGPEAPEPCDGGGGVRTSHFMSANHAAAIAHDLHLEYIDECNNAIQFFCHDGTNLTFSYCEGDVTFSWYWTQEAFDRALVAARTFYRDH